MENLNYIELEKFEAGYYEAGPSYKYFIPNSVNKNWVWQSNEINKLAERAAIKLGELNSYARLVPNIDLFIKMHVSNEAITSSRIEGTRTVIDETFLVEVDITPENKDDWKEVNNYIEALNHSIDKLETIPISSRLIKNTHKILLQGVRGENKLPGEFRSSQNWIGGYKISDAVFVPPHHQYINQLMGDLENFLHNDDLDTPELIRIAIAHYQFETIHPFLDGNGRIGRLLITLYLVSQGILSKPLLYLSDYFDSNKIMYYECLTKVRTNNDMSSWIKFFLKGLAQTATKSVSTLETVIKLKVDIEAQINNKLGRRANTAQLFLNYLFTNPVVNVEQAKNICSVSFKAANNLINEFINLGILIEMTGYSRNRLFKFEDYLKLFR